MICITKWATPFLSLPSLPRQMHFVHCQLENHHFWAQKVVYAQ